MKLYFINQFEYNLWANSRILKAIKDQDAPYKCIELLSHIISAQDIWFERIKKSNSYSIQVWDTYTIQECEILIKQSNLKWTNFINRLSEEKLQEEISYRNSRAQEFSNMMIDIIYHVLNHSNYHRAQINQLLSQDKLKPAVIDFIFYKRR